MIQKFSAVRVDSISSEAIEGYTMNLKTTDVDRMEAESKT
jgi:hypothetical protein